MELSTPEQIHASELAEFIVSERTEDPICYEMILHFPNGYGASLICFPTSYGGLQGLYEIAIVRFDDDNKYELCRSTRITNDVLGWLDKEFVMAALREIHEL